MGVQFGRGWRGVGDGGSVLRVGLGVGAGVIVWVGSNHTVGEALASGVTVGVFCGVQDTNVTAIANIIQ